MSVPPGITASSSSRTDCGALGAYLADQLGDFDVPGSAVVEAPMKKGLQPVVEWR
jgi:hypothetical protein